MSHTLWLPVLLLLAAPAEDPAGASTVWLTGDEFRRQLEMPVGFVWSGNPLRRAVSNLAQSQQVAIFLDRRVDPEHKVDLSVSNAPLDEAVRRLAAPLNLDVCYLDPVVYLGPPDVASRLATLAAVKRDEVGALPPEARTRWQRAAAWQWPRLATPRQLVEQLAEETGCRIVNLESVPHDLWPAVALPEMPVADRLSLVLASFSLTFELSRDGTAMRLVPLPEQIVWEHSYRPRGSPREAAQRIAELFPLVTVRQQGTRLQVAGSYEDHYQIDRWIQGKSVRRTEAVVAERRYSLEIKNTPAAAVINTVAKQLQLSVEVAPEVEEQLQQRVSFAVKEVQLDELLRAALDPVGATFALEDKTLSIRLEP